MLVVYGMCLWRTWCGMLRFPSLTILSSVLLVEVEISSEIALRDVIVVRREAL